MAICHDLELKCRLISIGVDQQDNRFTGLAHSLKRCDKPFIEQDSIDGNDAGRCGLNNKPLSDRDKRMDRKALKPET